MHKTGGTALLHTVSQIILTENVARKPWSLMSGMNRHIRSRAQIEQRILKIELVFFCSFW
ncbi:hypothetical protein KSD_17980 [Ktedonobacter sp. SOSP1-85]|nr:hypothetical protein KSD_17980 [Ktedonobacter sp. SOSP1-85]